MRKIYKMTLLLLVMIFLVSVLMPLGNSGNAAAVEDSDTSAQRVTELTELRSETSKTYLLADQTYETVVSAEKIHYQDSNGLYKEIKNSVSEDAKAIKNSNYQYKNTDNAYTARFGDMAEELPVLMEYGGGSIGFKPIGGGPASAQKGRAAEALKNIVPEENAVSYYDVYPGVDIIYETTTDGVKEFIILNDQGASNTYEFELTMNGLHIHEEEGVIQFRDETGESVMEVSGLMAFDANGDATDKVTCQVIENKGGTRLRVTLDEEYLADEGRAYPVVIDPSVMITGSNSTFDTFVSKSKPNTNYYMNNYLRVGYDSTYGIQRTLIKFNLPSTIPANNVTSAKLRIKKYSGNNIAISALRVTMGWTPKTTTWYKMPTYSTAVLGYMNIDGSNTSWYRIMVTDQVKNWLKGTQSNYGFLLKRTNETNNATVFYSSDAPSPNKPELVINYTENYGWRAYEDNKDSGQNCMGYALKQPKSVEYHHVGLTLDDAKDKTANQFMDNFLTRCIAYMQKKGIKFRRLSAYNSPINENEYRVVARVGFTDRWQGKGGKIPPNGTINTTGYIDGVEDPVNGIFEENPGFHWWYETKTGVWAEKNGSNNSRLIPNVRNPANGIWSCIGNNLSYLVYFAIAK